MEAHVSNERFPDWIRIRHLLKLGVFAALMVLAGDMLPGWGVHDASKSGMSIGGLWMFIGLPVMSRRAEANAKKGTDRV